MSVYFESDTGSEYLDWPGPHAVDPPQTSALQGISPHRPLPGNAEEWTSDQPI